MDDVIVRAKVVSYLKRAASPARLRVPILDDTELWYDLGIYGHDLFEFIMWAHDAFGIKPDLDIGACAPAEASFQFLHLLIGRMFGSNRSRSRFRSLTVLHVIEAAKVGQWQLYLLKE